MKILKYYFNINDNNNIKKNLLLIKKIEIVSIYKFIINTKE